MRRVLTLFFTVGLILFCLYGCVAERSATPAKTGLEAQNVFSLPATISKADGGMLTLEIKKPQLYTGQGKLALKLAQGVIDSSYLLEGKITNLGNARVKIVRVSASRVLARILDQGKAFTAGMEKEIYLDRKTIAIKDFEVIRGNNQEIARYVQEDVTTALVNSGQFNVVERMKLETVLGEIKLSQAGLVDPATVKQAGRLLGADLILTGTFVQTGEEWNVNLRLVNTETGLIVTAINRTGPLVEFAKEAIRETSQIAGSFEEGQKMTGWLLGEKFKGRTGKGGFRKVSVDKNKGARMSSSSLALDFKLGKERTKNNKGKNIYAALVNNLKRDMSIYKGITFHIRADTPLTVVFVLTDSQKGSSRDEQWLAHISVKEGWQQIDLPFRSLSLKRGLAKRSGTNEILELQLVESMAWSVNEKNVRLGASGTVWLDEVRFY